MSSFPSREDLKNKQPVVSDDGFDREMEINIKEKQKIFIWIRIFLKEEQDIEIGSKINMIYKPSGESMGTVFGAYNKKNVNSDNEEQVVEYVSDDDKTCLCLMVDLETINDIDNNLDYLRTIFKDGRYFDSNNLFIREDELSFVLDGYGELDYYLLKL